MTTFGQVLKTAPAAEPLTLAQAKLSLRVDHDDDDDDITAMIAAAREYVEAFLNRKLITQTWTFVADCFAPVVHLPFAPVSAVTAVRYRDSAGTLTTLGTSLWQASVQFEPARVMPAYGLAWPAVGLYPEAVEIDATVGYGTSGADCPPAVIAALRMTLATLFEHRESVGKTDLAELPLSARNILAAHVFMA